MKDKIEKDRVRVLHILDAIDEIEKYLGEASFSQFETNSMLQSACIRQLEVIGEAANHLTDNTKQLLKDVEWREIIGFRNMLIHEYFGIDITIVWEVISSDLPSIKIKMKTLLNKIEKTK